MKLIKKIVFWVLLSVSVLPILTYSMEQPSREEFDTLVRYLQEPAQADTASLPQDGADRNAPILEKDNDGLIMWGNIGAVAALALVLGYAFSYEHRLF